MTGSYNAWIFNVSRWMNSILSCSKCNNNKKYQHVNNTKYSLFDELNYNNSKCSFDKLENIDHGDCKDRNISYYYKEKYSSATFCTSINFDNVINNYKIYAGNDSRPIDTICDNLIEPYRPCTIYEGSGNHVLSVIGTFYT